MLRFQLPSLKKWAGDNVREMPASTALADRSRWVGFRIAAGGTEAVLSSAAAFDGAFETFCLVRRHQ